MKEHIYVIRGAILGVVALLIWIGVTKEHKVPFISTYKSAFFIMALVGFVMCSIGPLRGIKPNEWLNPFIVVAMILGGIAISLILMMVAKNLFGIKVPFVRDEKHAFMIISMIILVKFISASIHHIVKQISV